MPRASTIQRRSPHSCRATAMPRSTRRARLFGFSGEKDVRCLAPHAHACGASKRQRVVRGPHEHRRLERRTRHTGSTSSTTSSNPARAHQRLTGALEHEDEDFKGEGPVSPFGDPNQQQTIAATSGVAEYGLSFGAVHVSISARYDDNDEFDDATSRRGAARYAVAATGTDFFVLARHRREEPDLHGALRIHAGHVHRQPECSSGNRRERLRSVVQQYSASVAWVRVVWFHDRLEDEIDGFVFDPDAGAFTAENRDGTSRREGVELSAAANLAGSVSLRCDYTYLDATEPVEGRDVDEIRRPRHSGGCHLPMPRRRAATALNSARSTPAGAADSDFATFPATSVTLDVVLARAPVGELAVELDRSSIDRSHRQRVRRPLSGRVRVRYGGSAIHRRFRGEPRLISEAARQRSNDHAPDVGHEHRADVVRLHPDPEQISALRRGLGSATATCAPRSSSCSHGRAAANIHGLTAEIVTSARPHTVDCCATFRPTGGSGTVLLYGHYDKQPEFSGWADGLGPWTPVLREGRLYGRGGADDGYAMFGSLTAIAALDAARTPRARCVVLIEGCEESGSYDLPHYMDALASRIGTPDLVICLDAECGSYDRLWLTTSLRGLLLGTLSVEVLREGVHSGAASGIVPSSFRVLRQLLDRIEDSRTGEMLDALTVQIPPHVIDQARDFAATLGPMLVEPLSVGRRCGAGCERPGRAHAQQHVAPDVVGDGVGAAHRTSPTPATRCGRRPR